MNGKKMEWEAVVNIPSIEEDRLLKAMAPKNELLTDDEKARNGFDVPIKFTFSSLVSSTYRRPLDVANIPIFSITTYYSDFLSIQRPTPFTKGSLKK